ncbi:RICIN domain-containing protein [Streptomyces sp. HUAS TT20]|uniref:RICIN domain-containing protein n=1 Tax=Streptomyces sp. HUAS TT20 TaxID=3447509 RepID=UPI0021DB7072|nr:RICIN domain-containing protein [Streptomyces sp. HUAS 15-9]UXY32376.1 RICIN domain-containing protein [Streptomyces sp. HUAS 15-9]
MKKITIMRMAAGAAGAIVALSGISAHATEAKKPKLDHVQIPKMYGSGQLCLSMNNSTKNGAQLIAQRCNGSQTQKWTFKYEYHGSYGYKIKNDKSGKCLTVKSGRAGAAIVQDTCPRYNDQLFRWTAEDHKQKMANAYSRMALTVPTEKSGVKVVQQPLSGSRNKQQRFYLPAF